MADGSKRRRPGWQLFAEFLRRNQIGYREASTSLGTAHPSAWKWAKGEQRPNNKFRIAIEMWTDGYVPRDSWSTEDDEPEAPIQPYRPNRTAVQS